jgi:hypothetical protein
MEVGTMRFMTKKVVKRNFSFKKKFSIILEIIGCSSSAFTSQVKKKIGKF